MYDLLQRTVDRAITNVRIFTYRGQQFRITRHEFAPVTLKVTSITGPESFFEVDFVPSFQFDFRYISMGASKISINLTRWLSVQ